MNRRNLILLVLSIVAFALAAVLGFGWFDTTPDPGDILGLVGVGLALFAGAHIE